MRLIESEGCSSAQRGTATVSIGFVPLNFAQLQCYFTVILILNCSDKYYMGVDHRDVISSCLVLEMLDDK